MSPMDGIYLDHNATTPPSPAVVDAVAASLHDRWANPSSVHRQGQLARHALNRSRDTLAQLIAAPARQLVLTSGGTESNHLALHGLLSERPAEQVALITTAGEHAALREPAEALAKQGVAVEFAPMDPQGVVEPEAVIQLARAQLEANRAVLVSVHLANNETGVIQDLPAIADGLGKLREQAKQAGHRPKLWLHSDATQAVGKIPVDVTSLGLDLLTFSGHKFHGPRGLGGLYASRSTRLKAVQLGGPQERGLRGGTEAVALAEGAAVAAQEAMDWLRDPRLAEAQAQKRDRFVARLNDALPDLLGFTVHGHGAPRLWNTANVAFPGLEAEAILLGLSERGVCASAGAACSSGSLEPSPVLLAMSMPEAVAHGSVRFSLGKATTDAELDRAAAVTLEVVQRLQAVMPMGG